MSGSENNMPNPILKCEGDYRLFAFKISKDVVITRSDKTHFKSKVSMQTLFFTEARIFNLGEDKNTFKEGSDLYIIAKLRSGAYYAETVTTKPVYDCFYSYDKLEEKVRAQKKLFELPDGRRNNILLQARLIPWSYGIEVRDLIDAEEYELKLMLCYGAIPPAIYDRLEAELRHNFMLRKGNFNISEEMRYLGNIHYSSKAVDSVPAGYTTRFLKKKTFMSDENIKKFTTALSQSRSHALRVLMVGPAGASQDELVYAVGSLLNMSVQTVFMAGKSSAFEVVGESQSYRSPEKSVPAELWYKAKTNRCIFWYKDAGELGSSVENGSAKVALRRIIDRATFFDSYIKVSFPMQQTMIFTSTERIEDIDPGALEMFDIILHFEMSDREKADVMKRYYLDELEAKKGVTFTDEALWKVACFTDDFGMNRMKDYVRFLVSKSERGAKIDEALAMHLLSTIVDQNTPFMRYKLHKNEYTSEIADAIEDTHKLLISKNADKKPDYLYLKDRIDLLSKLHSVKSVADFNRETFLEEVNRSHFGLEKEKLELADYLTAQSVLQTGNSLRVYFLGPPGTGKTSIALSAAKALKHSEVCRIDLSAATPSEIVGLPKDYPGGGRPSLITSAIAKSTHGRVVVLLEEFEKADPIVLNLLLKLTDDDAAFRDKYADVDISVKGVHFFATANGEAQHCNLDRFRVFCFNGVTKREKTGVFEMLLSRIESECRGGKLAIEVDPEAKELIIDSYSQSSSVRTLDHKLRRITEHLISDKCAGKDDTICIRIDRSAVEEALPKPSRMGNFESIPNVPGVVRGLAVTASGMSMSFGIEALVYSSGHPSIETTGLPADDVLEQTKLAITYINAHYGNILENKSVHIHFGVGSIRKEGCSGGAATFLAIFSAAMGACIDRGIAVTGEISLHGGISKVGGIVLKAEAAIRDGCHLLIMPDENLMCLPDADRAYLEKYIRLAGVASVDELIDLAMPETSIVKLS